MRPGYRLAIVDLSATGALVEGSRPLRPGSRVDVQLESDARSQTIAALVVRCAVGTIDAESGVIYRAALSFAASCDWVREALTPGVHGLPADGAGVPIFATAAGAGLPVNSIDPGVKPLEPSND
jgi:hypothetical protein